MTDWFREAQKRTRRYVDAIYDAWITEALFTSYIAFPYPADVPYIVGYNPQLLLTARPAAEAMSMMEEIGMAFERIYPHRVAVIDAEHANRATLIAASQIEGVVGITINIDEPSGELPGYDFSAMLVRHELRGEEARAKPRPDYLKHDPSKRHGRGKRGRW